jgi:hypothetical protein
MVRSSRDAARWHMEGTMSKKAQNPGWRCEDQGTALRFVLAGFVATTRGYPVGDQGRREMQGDEVGAWQMGQQRQST